VLNVLLLDAARDSVQLVVRDDVHAASALDCASATRDVDELSTARDADAFLGVRDADTSQAESTRFNPFGVQSSRSEPVNNDVVNNEVPHRRSEEDNAPRRHSEDEAAHSPYPSYRNKAEPDRDEAAHRHDVIEIDHDAVHGQDEVIDNDTVHSNDTGHDAAYRHEVGHDAVHKRDEVGHDAAYRHEAPMNVPYATPTDMSVLPCYMYCTRCGTVSVHHLIPAYTPPPSSNYPHGVHQSTSENNAVMTKSPLRGTAYHTATHQHGVHCTCAPAHDGQCVAHHHNGAQCTCTQANNGTQQRTTMHTRDSPRTLNRSGSTPTRTAMMNDESLMRSRSSTTDRSVRDDESARSAPETRTSHNETTQSECDAANATVRRVTKKHRDAYCKGEASFYVANA
jgi:hypothetical protein